MLGIVILNYMTWEETVKCVESIYDTATIPFKIFIVDNDSPNDSYKKLLKKYENKKEIVCIQTNHNGGFSRGNMEGIRACLSEKIEYAILTNSDIIFEKKCIDNLYETIQNFPQTLLVAPKILDKDHKVITLPWKGKQSLIQYLRIRSPKKIIMQKEEMIGVQEIYMASGACFIVNVPLFAKNECLDESVFMYNEESIIAIKAQKAGYKLLFNTDAVVIHNHGASTEKGTLFTDAEILKSGMYYWKKYEGVSNGKVLFIYLFMTLRMNIKLLCGRVRSNSYRKYMKDCFVTLKNVLKMKEK